MDFQTILFIEKLRDLAERSKIGFLPWSMIESAHSGEIIYDDSEESGDGYPVVIGDNTLGIIDTYDTADYSLRVKFMEDGKPFIYVTSSDNDYIFMIMDGNWFSI